MINKNRDMLSLACVKMSIITSIHSTSSAAYDYARDIAYAMWVGSRYLFCLK